VWYRKGFLVLLARGLRGTVFVTITPAPFPEELFGRGQGALECWSGGGKARRGVRRRGSRGARSLQWR